MAQGLTRDVRRETRSETRRRETMRQCGFANVSSSHVSARLSSIVSRPRAHALSASGAHVRGTSLMRIHVAVNTSARRPYETAVAHGAIARISSNRGTFEVAGVSAKVNSVVPNLCAINRLVDIPSKISVFIHKDTVEVLWRSYFQEY